MSKDEKAIPMQAMSTPRALIAILGVCVATSLRTTGEPVSVARWGVNLPWINYGFDVGRSVADGTHRGFSAVDAQTSLETVFAARPHALYRVWLFADLRAGVVFEPDGTARFNDAATVYADMDALLSVAARHDVTLLPVLFDRTLAVEGDVGTARLGLHPEVFTNAAAQNALLTLFAEQLVDRYADSPVIYAWDILNEPEVAPEVMRGVVTNEQQWDFIRRFADMMRPRLAAGEAGQLLTTGSKDRTYLRKMLHHWREQGYTNVLTLHEFHYYNAMGKADLAPVTAEERALLGDTPILVGELSAASAPRQRNTNHWTEISEKMDYISQNGFAGGLFWHDAKLDNTTNDDLFLSPAEWNECTNWTTGIGNTRYPSGKRESRSLRRPDFFGAVYYHYENDDTLADGYGRVDVVGYADPGYEGALGLRYQYETDPAIDYRVQAYPAIDCTLPATPLLSGTPTLFTYYSNDNIEGIVYPYRETYTIQWADGAYTTHTSEVVDATGKAYIFAADHVYAWEDRYTWGNYRGFRAAWDANLELYGGASYPTNVPEFQSIYAFDDADTLYRHLDTYHRDTGGDPWPAGQSKDPAAANHPLTLPPILLRPHIDTLRERINVHELIATAGPGGTLAPAGTLLVPHGVSPHLRIDADPHYHIAAIRTNGTPVNGHAYNNAMNQVTLAPPPVRANGTVEADFSVNQWAGGVPETWLAAFYPNADDYNACASSDTDGDRQTAWREYWSGTVPTDPLSCLRITGLTPGPPIRLEWSSVSGMTYRILGASAPNAAFLPIDGAATITARTDTAACTPPTAAPPYLRIAPIPLP